MDLLIRLFIISDLRIGKVVKTLRDLSFNNVPLLVEVSIYKGGTFAEFIRLAFSQLSCRLSHLETLKLDIRQAVSILIPCYLVEIKYCRVPYSVIVGFQVYNQNYAFPSLSNLKHLELLVDADYCLSLGRLASFMKAAPDLRSLVLGLEFGTSNEDMATRESFQTTPSLPQGGRNSRVSGSQVLRKACQVLGEECCCTGEDCYKSYPVLVLAYGNGDQLPTGERGSECKRSCHPTPQGKSAC
nr:uncharacterized protein LOC108169615 [Malus domestica]